VRAMEHDDELVSEIAPDVLKVIARFYSTLPRKAASNRSTGKLEPQVASRLVRASAMWTSSLVGMVRS
jgi:hypothetical protein